MILHEKAGGKSRPKIFQCLVQKVKAFWNENKYCGMKIMNPVPNLECSRLTILYFNFHLQYYNPKKTRHAPVVLALQKVKYLM